MPETERTSYRLPEEDALRIWQALESLTESMTRLGHLAITQGVSNANKQIVAYFGPGLFEQISAAQNILEDALLSQNPALEETFTTFREDEQAMRYWGHDL